MRTLILERDQTTLPAQLLGAFKVHAAVDAAENDDQLKAYLSQAIAQFEIFNGVIVFKTKLTMTPIEADFRDGLLRLVSPVRAWQASAGEPAGDVSASYALVITGLSGTKLYDLAGAWAAGLSLMVEAGYDGATAGAGVVMPLDPDVQWTVFKMAANSLEYREVMVTSQAKVSEEWRNDLLAGHWVPRC
jgi:hypothetical protein